MRINRNIVECKDQGKPDWAKVAKVLIETLWNVKFQDAWKKEGENTVLIETLWNVKTVWYCTHSSVSSINRNIVECKAKHITFNTFHNLRINRNIVECKG